MADGAASPIRNIAPSALSPLPAGLVFFNRFAQQNMGVKIAPEPEALESVVAAPIHAELQPTPGTTSYRIALGVYLNEGTDEVVRTFALEGACNTLDFFRQAGWTPRLDQKIFAHLEPLLETLLVDVGTDEARETFSRLSQTYKEAVENQRPLEEVLNSLTYLNALKTNLVRRALERWR